jgi:phage shock protein PspC (stress-responsive transcriptional regulator)
MYQDDYTKRAPGQSKLLGACQGLSERTGVNATALRVATLVLLCLWFKLTVIAYCVTAVAVRASRR